MTADPTLAPKRGGLGLFSVISIVVFLLSGLSAAGAYGYEQYLKTNIDRQKNDLLKAKAAFEPDVIVELEELSQRTAVSEMLLANHASGTRLLTLLAEATLQTVQFTDLALSESPSGVKILELTGRAQSYSSVALQSDEFAKTKVFKNPIFSGIATEEAGTGVTFRVKLELDPVALSYAKSLTP